PSLLLYLPPRVLRLTGNFYILSSWRAGIFFSCYLALDSSSSFPCPTFRAIAKSVVVFLSLNSYFGLPSHVVLLWNSLGLLLCYADLCFYQTSVYHEKGAGMYLCHSTHTSLLSIILTLDKVIFSGDFLFHQEYL
ncbi:hypothetical protein STEG23_038312, partial [Scotinomys teguina]